MVDQEVRFLLLNTEYSEIAQENLIDYIVFNNFVRTNDSRIGAAFEVLLNRPHWDNGRRIERSFRMAASEYHNRTDEDVLGEVVLGRFSKNHYVVDDDSKSRPRASRKEFPDEDGSGSGSGSDSADIIVNEDEEEFAMGITVTLAIFGTIIIILAFVIVAIRSRAFLFKFWFAKGKSEMLKH